MVWRGTTATAGHVIIITHIVGTSTVSFFNGSTPVVGLPEGAYGLNVTSGNPGELMTYNLHFQLKVNGTLMPQEYFTDPRIRI